MRLILFDVDGTLVSASGAGRRALTRALADTYGTVGAIDRYDFRGKTDPRIVLDLMTAAGLAPAMVRERLAACFAVYLAELDRLIADGTPVRLMPGVADLVVALAARRDVVVGLLTGNIEGGARVKLRPTGLLPHFSVGAYGSDDADRRRLPAIARERARAVTGQAFAPDHVVVVGDTPLDVDCARADGAIAVAVATGQHATAELATHAPDLLFESFADTPRAVALLTGGPR